MSEEYIRPERVLIALQIILVPLYFFILSNSLQQLNVSFIPPTLMAIIIRIIIPIALSLPIVLFSYFQRYEISEAYEHMGETIWNLPASIKAFYGFNFFLVIVFGLPFFAPIISLSSGYFIGLVLFKKKEDVVQISRPLIRISTWLYLPFGIIIGAIFYFQISDFFGFLGQIWVQNINFLYLSSLNIANGALISALLLAIFDYFEKNSFTFEKPNFLNALLGIIVFISLESLLIYFYVSSTDHTFTSQEQLLFSIVNIIGFFLSLILIALRWLMRSENTEKGTGLVGWITIIVFQLVNLLSNGKFAIFSQTTAILLTSIIFILLFISAYVKAVNNN